MAKLKTTESEASVADFLNKIGDLQKRADCLEIARLMEDISTEPAKMWGGSIVGCGSYHYKYESGHEGDMCLIGFSPRKSNIVLYVLNASEKQAELLKKLGKHKESGSCLHINKLADVDKAVLEGVIKEAFDQKVKQYRQ